MWRFSTMVVFLALGVALVLLASSSAAPDVRQQLDGDWLVVRISERDPMKQADLYEVVAWIEYRDGARGRVRTHVASEANPPGGFAEARVRLEGARVVRVDVRRYRLAGAFYDVR